MSHLYLLGVATLTLTSASFAGSDTNADLQARLEAAEARISELSAATNANWLNDTRSDEIRSLVHDVLADADTRASLQGSGATAGYNNGFMIGSADGAWNLTINGLLQTRWSSVDDDTTTDGSQWGFNNETSWLHFSGTIAGDYSFDIRHELTTGDNTNDNDWANGSFALNDDWSLTMGSMKAALNRRDLIGDQNQMTLQDNDWTVGQGAMLSYAGDDMRVWAQLFNNADNADVAGNQSSYTYHLRGEFMLEGAGWSQFDTFTCADGAAAGTLLGFSYSGNDEGDSASATNGEQTTWTLDAQMQWSGMGLYVAYEDFTDDATSGATNTDTDTLYVQGSYFLDSDWEAYVAYTDSDGSEAAPLDGSIWTVGVNNYLAGQNARWTIEYNMDDSAAADNSDVNTLSTQLQFYF